MSGDFHANTRLDVYDARHVHYVLLALRTTAMKGSSSETTCCLCPYARHTVNAAAAGSQANEAGGSGGIDLRPQSHVREDARQRDVSPSTLDHILFDRGGDLGEGLAVLGAECVDLL